MQRSLWLLAASLAVQCGAWIQRPGIAMPQRRRRCLPLCVALGQDDVRPGEDLWAIVGISRHSSDAELRRAFRAQARRLHPDMGGDPRSFRRLVRAHDILSNAASRAAWERHAATVQQPRWERPATSGGPDRNHEWWQIWLPALSYIFYMYATWATLLWGANHIGGR